MKEEIRVILLKGFFVDTVNKIMNMVDLEIKKAKEEVFKIIEEANIYQEHESCIAIDKKEFQKLKEGKENGNA